MAAKVQHVAVDHPDDRAEVAVGVGAGATSTPPIVIRPVEITARFSTNPRSVEKPSHGV